VNIARLVLFIFAAIVLWANGCQKRVGLQPERNVHVVTPDTAQLHSLIANGSVSELSDLLKTSVAVNAPGRVGRTALMVAIEAKSLEKVSLLLEHGADPELTDDFNTTALGCAVQYDFIPAIQLFLEMGVDRGYQPKHPRKIVRFGASVSDMKMPAGMSDVMSESEWKSIMQEGLDSINQREEPLSVSPLVRDVQSLEALRLFLAAGDRLGEAPKELRYDFVGLPLEAKITASKQDFLRDQTRRFGRENPEPMNSPFWNDMVRTGGNGYSARKHFLGKANFDTAGAIWCNDRFGASLTQLPDGRFIQIGGEHEDHYDPDFCIYNDVIVFDGRGNFQIYGYSRDAFPPTDFHSATLVGEDIYVLGSLGYSSERKFETTQVYRLSTKNFEMQRVDTSGDNPGWIHNHLASFDETSNSIRVFGGEVQKDSSTIVANAVTFVLHLDVNSWSRVVE